MRRCACSVYVTASWMTRSRKVCGQQFCQYEGDCIQKLRSTTGMGFLWPRLLAMDRLGAKSITRERDAMSKSNSQERKVVYPQSGSRLLIDKARYPFHSSTPCQPSDRRLSDALDCVAQNLSMPLRSSLPKPFSSKTLSARALGFDLGRWRLHNLSHPVEHFVDSFGSFFELNL